MLHNLSRPAQKRQHAFVIGARAAAVLGVVAVAGQHVITDDRCLLLHVEAREGAVGVGEVAVMVAAGGKRAAQADPHAALMLPDMRQLVQDPGEIGDGGREIGFEAGPREIDVAVGRHRDAARLEGEVAAGVDLDAFVGDRWAEQGLRVVEFAGG